MAAREGAGRLRWPLSAALRSVHKTKDIKSATFDVLAAGSLHGHVCMYVHVRSTLVVCRLYACAVCAPMACRLIWGFGLPLHVLCVRCCASWDFRVPASEMRLQRCMWAGACMWLLLWCAVRALAVNRRVC